MKKDKYKNDPFQCECQKLRHLKTLHLVVRVSCVGSGCGVGCRWDVDGVLLLTLLLVIWFLHLKKFFFSFVLWGGLSRLVYLF